jgi:hypothetical protein
LLDWLTHPERSSTDTCYIDAGGHLPCAVGVVRVGKPAVRFNTTPGVTARIKETDMRLLLRTMLCCGVSLCMAAAIASMPTAVSVTVHGDFDAGTSGGTATNSPTQSSLAVGAASLLYDNSEVSVTVLPGDRLAVTLGTVQAATGAILPASFTGATLNLTLELNDPPAAPAIAVIPLTISGSVGASGETLTLTASPAENEADFLTTLCVPKIISVIVDPTVPTTVIGGDPPQDISANLSIVYGIAFAPGDVDGDGSVTLIDAVKGLQIISGIDVSQCDEVERGDIVGTGMLDMVNIVRIARKSYGLV